MPDSLLCTVPDHLVDTTLAAIHRAGLGQRARIISTDCGKVQDKLSRSGVPIDTLDQLPGETRTSYLLLHVPDTVEDSAQFAESVLKLQTWTYLATKSHSALLDFQVEMGPRIQPIEETDTVTP